MLQLSCSLKARRKRIAVIVALGLVGVSIGVVLMRGNCSVHIEEVRIPSLDEVTQAEWDRLSRSRIYFGHQSVGSNIVQGLEDVMKTKPEVKLNIVETRNPDRIRGPVFAHSRIGENRNPSSKMDDFTQALEQGLADRIDTAFMKLCYVDVTEETDPEKVFGDYKNALSRLKVMYPRVRLVHVTLPLTSIETGGKARIKKLIGRPVRGCGDNMKRKRFNELLRSAFGGKEPIFDLAMVEATGPDGRRFTHESGGNRFEALLPIYTDDGGHLNENGRRRAAEQLLVVLARLPE